MSRWIRVAEGPAPFLPGAAVLAVVLGYGVNVPFWDQWELVELLSRLDDGGVGWADLYRQHNEHRMVFPKILMLALSSVTRWNVVAEMLVGVALASGSFCLLLSLARPALQMTDPVSRFWAVLAMSAILFSLAQWENWLWGWQIQWHLGVFAALLSIWLAARSLRHPKPFLPVIGAAASATLCQFSIASGVIVWLCSGLVLAAHPRRRAILSAWTMPAIIASAVFLVGYERAADAPQIVPVLQAPFAYLLYIGNYLSGPLLRHWTAGIAIAAVFAALAFAATMRRPRDLEFVLPWMAVGTFAIGNAILTAIGRVGLGPQQGLAARYVTISLLLSIAIIPLGLAALKEGHRLSPAKRLAAIGGAALLSILTIASDIGNWRRSAAHGLAMAEARACLLAIEEASDACLAQLYPNAAVIRSREPQLRAFGWSGFASPTTR